VFAHFSPHRFKIWNFLFVGIPFLHFVILRIKFFFILSSFTSSLGMESWHPQHLNQSW
jgi:hypothetical protein